jgi:hypothetical protein
MKNIFVILSVFFLSFTFVNCKKIQPKLSNGKIGCDCAKEVSAEFLMEEMTTGNINFARFTDTDTIYSNKNVRFTADEIDAEYKWYIGTELLTTKSVTRFFSNTLINQTLPISLVIKKKPNNICFPNDDGYDSITKYLTIVEKNIFYDNTISRLEGQYKVKSPLLSDSTIITIDIFYQNSTNQYLNVYNYDGLGSNCINVINGGGIEENYRQLWTFGSTGIMAGDYLQGDIHDRLDGQTEMNFTTGGYLNGSYVQKLKDWKYKGRKL